MTARSRCVVLAAVSSLALAIAGAGAGPVSAGVPAPTTIVNGDATGPTLRFDTDGNAIDAHDGEIQRFGNRYVLYGTSYGCGFAWQTPGAPFCGFRSYSSTDLVHWRNEGPLFDATSAHWQQRCNGGTYGCFRPHVLRSPATGRYVLWFNSYDVGVGYHVLSSASPTGPFVEEPTPQLAVNGGLPAGLNNGDHDVFADRDGTAYVAYTDWRSGGDIVVEKLRPDYLSGTGEYTRLGLRSVEAPSLFRRGDTYYLTVSDPNCGYCGGTGTSYLTAPTPLGPWTGAPASDPSWSVADGQLTVSGGGIGLSRDGAGWTDYTLAVDVTPLPTGGGGTYAQAGWVFRASGPGDGYAWLLGNYPHPGAEGGNLTKVVFRNGGVVSTTVVKTPMPVVGGQTYAVRTEITGSSIRTFIDGAPVDETTDTTFAAGRVGFRESGGSDGESARFDNVRVTAPDGTVLLTDDFSGDLSRWDRPVQRKGIRISTDSCGGQPADVAELPARGGPVYLYQSDLWNNGAHNEALALHHWEPLRFRADGSIEPLTCGTSYDLPLAGLDGVDAPAPAPAVDASTGDAGFHPYCDVSGPYQRAQTFTAGRGGVLEEVRFTTFRSGSPGAPLELSVARLGADGRPGTPIATRTVLPDQLGWSPAQVSVHIGLTVQPGERFALVVRTGAGGGCYGIAYSDGDPYPAGTALYSSDSGTSWRVEQGRDLRLSTIVSSISSTN
jgi:hypothetical protein